jgi:hypothetical protein
MMYPSSTNSSDLVCHTHPAPPLQYPRGMHMHHIPNLSPEFTFHLCCTPLVHAAQRCQPASVAHQQEQGQAPRLHAAAITQQPAHSSQPTAASPQQPAHSSQPTAASPQQPAHSSQQPAASSQPTAASPQQPAPHTACRTSDPSWTSDACCCCCLPACSASRWRSHSPARGSSSSGKRF